MWNCKKYFLDCDVNHISPISLIETIPEVFGPWDIFIIGYFWMVFGLAFQTCSNYRACVFQRNFESSFLNCLPVIQKFLLNIFSHFYHFYFFYFLGIILLLWFRYICNYCYLTKYIYCTFLNISYRWQISRINCYQ